MFKKKVAHIYYNTSGNSGLYLNSIDNALCEEFEQKFFVNFYYPLQIENYIKIFFPLTEKNEHNLHIKILKSRYIRKILRYFELKKNNITLFYMLKKWNPDIINYSLTNMPDAYNVLKIIKIILPNVKILVTCHDVIPFQETNNINYKAIYNYADYLIVHTQNAISILENTYKILANKILYHPFPLIDLSLLLNNHFIKKNKYYPSFLFIGVMRQEKGIQYLLDAWEILGPDFPAELVVAGFKPKEVSIDFSKLKSFKNFKILEGSLSDEEYIKFIINTDYVIFPYIKVGNSGVLSTVISLNKVPLTTNLPTFIESQYCLNELSCNPGDSQALASLIKQTIINHSEKYKVQQKKIKLALEEYKKDFQVQVLQVYKKIM